MSYNEHMAYSPPKLKTLAPAMVEVVMAWHDDAQGVEFKVAAVLAGWDREGDPLVITPTNGQLISMNDWAQTAPTAQLVVRLGTVRVNFNTAYEPS